MTNPADLATQRLISHQLIAPSCQSVAQVVQHLGAMQAQDYDMAQWAIGVRLPGATSLLVDDAINRGEILRTHLLRPTWHFVAARDIYWLLDLTAPAIKRLVAGRNRDLGLEEAILSKSNAVIEQALAGHTYLTRNELMSRLQLAGLKTNELRASHLTMHAELTGLVCNGPCRVNERGIKQQTYALLAERVPDRQSFSREQALAELAKRYFTSHGPATLADFVWWSGLSVTDGRRAIDGAKPLLNSVMLDSQLYWLAASAGNVPELAEQIHFLPAFDEFVISYCNRNASIAPEFAPRAITSNGIFKPLLVVDGQMVGIWKRTVKQESVTIELTFFYALPSDLLDRICDAAQVYGTYLGKETRINVV